MSDELNLFEQEVEVIPAGTLEEHELVQILEEIKANAAGDLVTHKRHEEVKRLIEALLFASTDPLPLKKIREITDTLHPLRPRVLLGLLHQLKKDYEEQKRGFQIDEIAQGFILRSCKEYGKYVRQLFRNRRGEKLSQAATEVLAIIAYRQPITRAQIEKIRGVDSTGIIHTLLDRGLIEVVGRLEAPGRPSLYSTTNTFLKHFGMRNLGDLPPLLDEQNSL